MIIPNYDHVGEIVASALSVLFGKRFGSHGPFEMSGSFGMPEFSAFAMPCEPQLIYNNARRRADRGVPLDLSETGRMMSLLTAPNVDPRIVAFSSAAKFYRRALMTAEADPESAIFPL